MTCIHESRTQSDELTHWVCDDCGEATPLTEKELDWQPWNHDHCVSCGHSAKFGGALEYVTPTNWVSLRPYYRHTTPCA